MQSSEGNLVEVAQEITAQIKSGFQAELEKIFSLSGPIKILPSQSQGRQVHPSLTTRQNENMVKRTPSKPSHPRMSTRGSKAVSSEPESGRDTPAAGISSLTLSELPEVQRETSDGSDSDFSIMSGGPNGTPRTQRKKYKSPRKKVRRNDSDQERVASQLVLYNNAEMKYSDAVKTVFNVTENTAVQTATLHKLRAYATQSKDKTLTTMVDLLAYDSAKQIHAALLLAGYEAAMKMKSSSATTETVQADMSSMSTSLKKIESQITDTHLLIKSLQDNLIKATSETAKQVMKNQSEQLLNTAKETLTIKAAPLSLTLPKPKSLEPALLEGLKLHCGIYFGNAVQDVMAGELPSKVIVKYRGILENSQTTPKSL